MKLILICSILFCWVMLANKSGNYPETLYTTFGIYYLDRVGDRFTIEEESDNGILFFNTIQEARTVLEDFKIRDEKLYNLLSLQGYDMEKIVLKNALLNPFAILVNQQGTTTDSIFFDPILFVNGSNKI